MNDIFTVLIHFPIAPFSWTRFSSSIKPSELLPSLRIETLLSQCNYICQTHMPVCPKNASIILLITEIVPRNMWHDSYGPLFGRVANYISYFLASNYILIPGLLTFVFCLHLWQLCSEIHCDFCVDSNLITITTLTQ